jgi:hypothetical protein
MIRIGFDYEQKQKCIEAYLSMHKIEKVYIFYFQKFKPEFQVDCEIEYVEFTDLIEYNPFYRLVTEINKNSLVIVDEFMRTQNRHELTYNCVRNCTTSCNTIIFEYFPIIDDIQNIQILIDFDTRNRYKGQSFKSYFLDEIDIKSINRFPVLEIINIDITKEILKKYEDKKNYLFDNLGKKHPDTIITNLELYIGNFKKPYILENKNYVSRNDRFKKSNVSTFKNTTEKNLTMIDYPIRQIELNDYIKASQSDKLTFISSQTKTDLYYITQYNRIYNEVGEIYAKTSI